MSYSVNKISTFKTPSFWDILLPNLYLFTENLISNFLSCFANIGSSSHHAFIDYDAKSIIIYSNSMIMSTHHLRCLDYNKIWLYILFNYWIPCVDGQRSCLTHISRCSTCIWGVFWLPNSGYAKVSNSEIALEYR